MYKLVKTYKKLFKEQIKQILCWYIQKESEYSAPRNLRFGEWQPTQENPPFALSITIPLATPKIAMFNIDATITKKGIEIKKHSYMINVLKESVGATSIRKRILDLGISWTMCKLLTSTQTMKKQLIKAISKYEAVQFLVNTLSSAKVLEVENTYFWYFIEFSKAKVCLEYDAKVTVLFDTDTEINVIIRELIEDTNLAI